MSISYAGVSLAVPTQEATDWIENNIDPAEVYEFVYPTWLRSIVARSHVHHTNWGLTPQRPLYVSRLYWPTGASRWSVGHFLVSDRMLDEIRAQVYLPDGSPRSRTLVLGDGRFTLAADMWMLPARPLSQIPGHNGMSLLTLVDERYYWWFKRGTVTVLEGTTTWAQLYSSLASLLGISLTADSIPSAYLLPPSSISSKYENLPLVLDTVARAVGQRIVRGMDGSVRALNVTTSQALAQANLDQIGSDPNDWHKQAGGVFSLTQ